MRAQQRTAPGALHRREAIAPVGIETQQEAHPPVAQRADTVEHDHRAVGGGLTAVRASRHSGSGLLPRARSHQPEKSNAAPALLRGSARRQTSAWAAAAPRTPTPGAPTNRCRPRGPAGRTRNAPRPAAHADGPRAPTTATPSASGRTGAPSVRHARVH
ncbi:hypothetical protein G6F31_015831 [Rhizopus arrhizus]|nr:hypothetical protein G6F31_015831 [Rhizopus arrhizus]